VAADDSKTSKSDFMSVLIDFTVAGAHVECNLY